MSDAGTGGRRRRAGGRVIRRGGSTPGVGLLATTPELERLVDLSVDLLCVATQSGRFVVVNPAWSETLGWPESELRGRKAIELVHPDDRERMLAKAALLAEPGVEVRHFEARFLHRDGSARWLDWSARSDGRRIYAVARDVTQHKRAEAEAHEAHEALRASEQRLRKVVETAHEGIWLLDADDRTSFVNERGAEMLGYSVEEMLGRPVHDFLSEHGQALATARLAARRQGVSDSHELRYTRKDGGDIWAIVSSSPLTEEDGTYAGSLDMLVDVTDRRLREQALRSSEERYRNIIETTSEGVWMIDADHRTTYVNRRMAEMLGYRVDEMLGRPVADFAAPEGRHQIQSSLASRRAGVSDQRELPYLRKDGSEMWALLSGSPLSDGNGGYGGALAMISDITERKRAEQDAARLAAIVESSPDAIFSTDLEGRITSWNRAAQQLYGYTEAEAVGKSVWMLAPEDKIEESREVTERLLRGGATVAYRTTAVHRDGTVIDVEPSVSAIVDRDGTPVGALAIIRAG